MKHLHAQGQNTFSYVHHEGYDKDSGMETSSHKYPLSLRIIHWLMAVLVIALIIIGLTLDEFPRGTPLRSQMMGLHKSLGVTVLALALLRVALRLRSSIPPLPEVIPALERRFAHLGHMALYGFMLAIPLSGLILSNSFGFAVSWFGLFDVPLLVGVDKDRGHMAGEVHEFLAYTMIGLIALHVAGAAKHLLKEHINLFKRIM